MLLIFFDPQYVFESVLLLSITNGLFISGIGLVIGVYAALGFLKTGSFSILMIGCGNISFGIAAGIAGLVIDPDGPNVNVTIYNCGALTGALFHLFGTIKTDVGWTPSYGRPFLIRKIVSAYLSAIFIVIVIATAAMLHWTPLFFVQGRGPTAVRQIVLGCALSGYAVSALLLFRTTRLKDSGFLYWYSRGLLLMAIGLFANSMQTLVGSPLGWSGRIGNYLASIFLLASLLSTQRKTLESEISLEAAARKLFEEPVRLHKGLVSNMPDAVVSIDQAGRILVWNAAAENMFGYSRKEATGHSLFELIVQREDRGSAALKLELGDVKEGENLGRTVQPDEILVRHKDGREIPVEQVKFKTEITKLVFYTCIFKDITQKKKIQSVNSILQEQARSQVVHIEKSNVALRLATAVAENANKAKSRFLATASHDLRQPLQALTLLNEALLKTVDDPKAQKMLTMQRESLSGMGRLLNSLLDISTLESGAVHAASEDTALRPIFEHLSADFKVVADKKGLLLELEVGDIGVRTDSGLLSQILHNLLANAIRYTKQGYVRIGCVVNNDQVRIEVSDSGIGIPVDQLTLIFDEFYQVDRDPQQRHGGIGLGLSIVDRLASLLGTTVVVQSEVGRGSTFSITLAAAEAKIVQAVTLDVINDQTAIQKGVILLIDDDSSVLEASQMLLKLEGGFEITTATSPPEAYAVLEELKPDLIISDFHLSHQDTGLDIVRVARDRAGRTIPAILVSGDTGASMAKIHIENIRFFSKPLNAEDFVRAAHQLLQASSVKVE
jgi:PAS domain S-box-containing protein